MNESVPPNRPFLKLAPNFYVLWAVLWFVIASKVLLLRETTGGDILWLAGFGLVLLAGAYLGAWLIWRFSGRNQRVGEVAFVTVMTLIFLIPTVWLYREAAAAMGN